MSVVDVMMGKANPVPYENQADMSEIQRRNLLLQQMLKSAGTPASGVVPGSGALVVPNYAGAIGKVLESVIGVKGAENAAAEQSAITKRADETHRQATENYYKTAYEGRPMGAGPGEEMVMTKADKVAALREAAGGKDPLMRTWALKAQEERDKIAAQKEIGPLDLAKDIKNFDPNSRMLAEMIPGLRRMPDTGQVGGVGYSMDLNPDGTPKVATAPIERFGPVSPGGPGMPPSQEELNTGKVQGISGGNLSTQPAVAFNKDLAGLEVKIAGEGREKALAGFNTLQTIATAQDQIAALPDAAVGPASGVRLLYNQVVQELGGQTIPESVGVERLNSALGERMLERLRLFAPVSNSDKDEMKQIAGSSKNGKEALTQMLDLAAKITARGINSHNTFIEGLEKKEGYGDLSHLKVLQSVTGQEATKVPGAAGAPKRVSFSDLPE